LFYSYHEEADKVQYNIALSLHVTSQSVYDHIYEGWNFNSGNYLFTTDTK